jgi:hypothetical protein
LVNQRRNVTNGPTEVLVLDAHNLQIVRRLSLKGGFTFDAISPDGSRLYFIQYLSPRDLTRYAVRAYDVDEGRLLPIPVVDPDEHAGEMRGHPLERVTGSDGRWAYTLYDGGDGEPFVHALDTVRGRAVCVDLDGLVASAELRGVHMAMSPGGDELTIGTKKTPVAVIDTESLEAHGPPAPGSSDTSEGSGFPWIVVLVGGALGLIGGGAFIASRRRREASLPAP